MIFKILVVLYATLGASRLTKQVAAAPWMEPHYIVYATKGKPIEPSQTSNLLMSLRDIYDSDTSADKGVATRLKKVRELLQVEELVNDSNTVCHGSEFDKINKVIKYNSPFKINIIPYLQNLRQKLFSKCKVQFDKIFKDLLSQFGPHDRDNLDPFLRYFPDDADLTDKVIKEKFVDYMQDKYKILKDRSMVRYGIPSTEKLKKFLDDKLLDLCQIQYIKLKEEFHMNQLGNLDLELFEKGTPERSVMVYMRVCDTLVDEFEGVLHIDDLQNDMCERRHKLIRAGKLFGEDD